MGRLAVTFWFTISTLFGPGVCCCSFARAHALATSPTLIGRAVTATEPVKSCCHEESFPSDDDGTQPPERGESCPCGHSKWMKTSPMSELSNPELAAQLRLLTEGLGFIVVPFGFDAVSPATVSADHSPPCRWLAGRDLLAAYSRLRC